MAYILIPQPKIKTKCKTEKNYIFHLPPQQRLHLIPAKTIKCKQNSPMMGWHSLTNKSCVKMWKNVQKKLTSMVNYVHLQF